MANSESLHSLLDDAVRRWPGRVAAQDTAGSISYRALGELSDRLRDRLVAIGVRPGDRVGIYLRKSIDSLASIFGILKTGAAYVPVGPDVPASRNAFVFEDCSVKAIITEREFESGLKSALSARDSGPIVLVLETSGGGVGLDRLLNEQAQNNLTPSAKTAMATSECLAYILYTSGSTGRPKGVMLTHGNGLSFVNWCSEVFHPNENDCFSSHAPFHFDLSILDIYVPLKHGARVVLISAEIGKDPRRLGKLIADSRITVWYSTPSVLTILTEYGSINEYDYSSLRMVLFAGEVFPIKHLKALTRLLPSRRYFNLYGPTETNVCTYYEVPAEIPDARSDPYPIGKACSHLSTKVIDEKLKTVSRGVEGELCVHGPAVMQGYWNRPELADSVFATDADGRRWYRTGDVVVEEPDGNYRFVGRRDRMVKRRGFRVELGEIEATLYGHPDVEEAAVIAVPDGDAGVRIMAFLNCGGARLSIIQLKSYCAERLPVYMVPDAFSFQASLPKTSTDKTDYERLKALA